ncbi:MAG: FHA domain-containing protein [Gammaproteobacteria bacterium]|nr:FHA domain-containing protein [Gammaproteobacteria bacterium]
MAQLALLVDDVVVKLFPLEKPTVTIGRDQVNDIQIEDTGVSGKHAQIHVQPSGLIEGHVDVEVEDLGSTNGTLVNDELRARCQLKPNDVITIGFNQFKLLDDREAGSETTAHIIRG